MDSKGKSHEVEADRSAQIAVAKKDKKRKKISQTDRKLHKTSHPREVSSTEKDTPMEKEEEEFVCLFESEDSDMKNTKTIFVKGFDCSIPIPLIKPALRKHFTSCGLVSMIFIPYECKTASPLGYGFINMSDYPEKALSLHGSSLGGMTLEVTMARGREGFLGYTNFNGCERCRNAIMKRRLKKFHESFRTRIPGDAVYVPEPVGSAKKNEEANRR